MIFVEVLVFTQFCLVLQLQTSDGAYSAPLYNRTLNMCNMLNNPEKHPLFFSVYDKILNYGNFPEKCPFPKVKVEL